jgi:ribosomal-protein-alanine N-acetyltransferase
VRSLADAEVYITSNIQAGYGANGFGLYALELKSAGAPIGLCGLLKRDFLPCPDLGFALLPEYVGQRYASEAAREVMRHARSELGLGRLYAIVKQSNRRSVGLLERLGFRHEGPCLIAPGDEVELYVTG